MNLKKILVGLAQSDTNYGFKKNNNIKSFIDIIIDQKLGLDTDPSYKNSKNFFCKKKINSRIVSKLSPLYCKQILFKTKLKKQINLIFKNISGNSLDTILIKDPLLPLDSKKWKIAIDELMLLKKKGKIKKIGVSVYTTEELDRILKVFTPDVVQFPLNIFNQSFLKKNYLQNLKKKNIELHARSIFLQGLLLQKKKNLQKYFTSWIYHFQKWYHFIKLKKKSAFVLSLQFAFKQKIIDKFVIGFDNQKQIKEFLYYIKKFKYKNIDFKKLRMEDEYLIDPRYWPKNRNIFFNKNQNKWIDAKNIIPTGNMLLSKRPTRFLKGSWPTYFSKAKECFVWDLDNKKFLDFSLMGIGTNILGYSNNKVNLQIKKTIDRSNMSTLNSYEEVILAKKLLNMHKWAENCFFAKTGGEASTIAIRIARSFIKKNKIAICGYHGWHDWYLSSNLKNKNNLNFLHLSGLGAEGIPHELSGLTIPFKYNDLDHFKKMINLNPDIGIVFMEVQRNEKPKKNFLSEIRKITLKKNIVLIFDECTSGFRETFGGLHLKYNVNPDICILGKSIANGIPLTAIIGKKNIMMSANNSFISSTFWTDRLGFVAGLSTLNEMKRLRSWKIITRLGIKTKIFWKKISKKYNLPIKIYGLDAMPTFEFISNKNEYYKNYITQEMLKFNILCSNTIYFSIYHKKFIYMYFKLFEQIFLQLKKIDEEGSILRHLTHPLSDKGFQRLN